MPNIIEITDFHAPELDPYARLTQNQLRNRLEPEKGIFIAESPKVIDRALDAGYKPVSLLMERKQITGPAAGILSRCGDAPVYTADREMLAELTGFELTRGVLCAFRRPAPRPVEELCKNARRVAVLEGIVDSTNVGAIFRSAAALNMDAVLINPSCCDPLCRRAVRVSMGTVFQVPWGQLGETPADWPEKGMDILHSLGFKTAAMALSDRSVSTRHHAVLLAGLRKAGSSSAAGKLAMDTGLADKGTAPLHFDQIPFGAQFFHGTAHRDAADRVLRTQFRLRGDLLIGFVFAALDRGTNVILYLLVKRDDSTIIDRHEIPHPQIEYIVINIIFISWL